MAAPWHLIEQKAEDAIYEVIDDQATLTGVNKYKGLDTSEIATPSLEVFAASAEPEQYGESLTGNWMVEVTCRVRTSADDSTRAVHNGFVGEVRDVLIQGDGEVVTAIQALTPGVSDFTAQQWFPGETTHEPDEERNQRITDQVGTLKCAPSDL